ncbi:MAG: hypothetical protein P8N07_11380 [Flavobacteriales bacterium]|nr:hypothetical protein [Flavobacteriales bacterium]MDG1176383.1 hypothetical protein [Flavobacteriales bacterium]
MFLIVPDTLITAIFRLVLAVTVTYLVCSPNGIPGVNLTVIDPVSQGSIAFFVYSGTVQVHEPLTLIKTNFSEPVFVNVNVCLYS